MAHFSNGTEWMSWQDANCMRGRGCVHQTDYHGINERGGDGAWACPIWDVFALWLDHTPEVRQIREILVPLDGYEAGPCPMFYEKPEPVRHQQESMWEESDDNV